MAASSPIGPAPMMMRSSMNGRLAARRRSVRTAAYTAPLAPRRPHRAARTAALALATTDRRRSAVRPGGRTVGRQHAGVARRRARVTDAASVQDQGVVEEDPAVHREQRLEIALDLVRSLVTAEPQAAGQAADVRVDRDPGSAERVRGHDVRGE